MSGIEAKNTTFDRLAQTRLALHAFKIENGAYPQNLKQLVPHYLKSVPRDPFFPSQTLKYKNQTRRVAVSERYPAINSKMTAPTTVGVAGASGISAGAIPIFKMLPFTLYSVGADGVDNGGKAFSKGQLSNSKNSFMWLLSRKIKIPTSWPELISNRA